MDKTQLRDSMRAAPAIGDAVSRAVAAQLFAWLSKRVPGTVTTYRAMSDEVDISSLVARLPGWRWILPRIEDDSTLTWRDARVPLEEHRWGMEQPTATGPVVPLHEIDVFLVPGLAFDRGGARLGRGRGFYDRELSARRADAVTIGVTIESRVLEDIPVEDHDERVHLVATESAVTEATPTS